MSAKGTVVYLSSCAIDGKGTPDPFMLQELPWLLAHFDRVLMVSYYGVAELTGVEAEQLRHIPVKGSKREAWRAWLCAPFVPAFWRELFWLVGAGKPTPLNLLKLLLFTIRGHKLHFWLEELLKTCELPHTTLYACWMSFDAYAASLSKAKHPQLRFLARGHAFDIDVERNSMNPYLMKRFIAGQADGLFLISGYAKAQYLVYMAGVVDMAKLHVVGMGSKGSPVHGIQEPPFWGEGTLRLMSCATICEIKQLPVLIDALSRFEGTPLHWLHMGGGPQEAEVRAYAAKKLDGHKYVTYHITGQVENEKVQRTYEQQAFDVFVNTSRMEGVPVSIMEAMRFGIPIIAPRVGGIPELVDESVGILYEADRDEPGSERPGREKPDRAVLEAIQAFAALPKERVMAMREAAQRRWQEECRSDALLPRIFAQEGGTQEGVAQQKEGGGRQNG